MSKNEPPKKSAQKAADSLVAEPDGKFTSNGKGVPSTPSTGSTTLSVEPVEGVEGQLNKPIYDWYKDKPLDYNFRRAGRGLDRGRAEALLSGEEGLAAIRAAEEHARRSGVQGVPFFLINSTIALSGAREPSDFLDAFEQAGTGPTTGDEGVCNVGPGVEPSC